jgi:hypothetical protein
MKARHGTVSRYNDHGCRCSDCREAIRAQAITRREVTQANGGTHPGPITHGRSGYINYSCRCETCRAGHRACIGRLRTDRYAATAANGGVAPAESHGASTYANWGCRCDICRTDLAKYRAELRARRRANLVGRPA